MVFQEFSLKKRTLKIVLCQSDNTKNQSYYFQFKGFCLKPGFNKNIKNFCLNFELWLSIIFPTKIFFSKILLTWRDWHGKNAKLLYIRIQKILARGKNRLKGKLRSSESRSKRKHENKQKNVLTFGPHGYFLFSHSSPA